MFLLFGLKIEGEDAQKKKKKKNKKKKKTYGEADSGASNGTQT